MTLDAVLLYNVPVTSIALLTLVAVDVCSRSCLIFDFTLGLCVSRKADYTSLCQNHADQGLRRAKWRRQRPQNLTPYSILPALPRGSRAVYYRYNVPEVPTKSVPRLPTIVAQCLGSRCVKPCLIRDRTVFGGLMLVCATSLGVMMCPMPFDGDDPVLIILFRRLPAHYADPGPWQ
jgi:hypothetical protein